MKNLQELHEYELVELANYYCKHYPQCAVEVGGVLERALEDTGFDYDFGYADMQEEYADEMDRLCNPPELKRH